MLLPFHRGYQTWSQRLQAVEFAHKIERLQDSRADYAFIENGLHLPLSSDLYNYIASPSYLEKQFGSRFLRNENCLQFSFKDLYNECQQKKAVSINDMGPEFDFSLSLYFDQYFLQRANILQTLRNVDLNTLSSEVMHWLQKGLDSYLDSSFSEALRCYREALRLEPSLYVILYRIGLIYFNSTEWADEGHALEYFTRSAQIALLKDDRAMAAQAYLHAAFATYLLTKDDEAVQLIHKAISLDSTLSESYYLNAKIISHDSSSAVMMLQTAIMLNPHYAIKIDADPDLESIQNDLFKALQKQARDRAQIRFTELEKERSLAQHIERSIKESESTIGQVGAHRQFFERIKNQFDQLIEIYRRGTFFDLRIFTEQYDQHVLSGESLSLSKAIRERYSELQNLAKDYKANEKTIESANLYCWASRIGSLVAVDIAFASCTINMIELFDLSADWLTLIPVFYFCTLLIALADWLFEQMDRILFYLKVDWLRGKREPDHIHLIISNIRNGYLFTFSVFNIFIFFCGLAIWLTAGLRQPPYWLLLGTLFSHGFLKIHRKYQYVGNEHLEIKNNMNSQINRLLSSEPI
jgi:tetratricopeptide (TPR) repeat protein